MGKWHNYQFLEKRVAGQRTPCLSCGVVPCLADVPRNTTRVWNSGNQDNSYPAQNNRAVETTQVFTAQELKSMDHK
jgi:hypothetical protein